MKYENEIYCELIKNLSLGIKIHFIIYYLCVLVDNRFYLLSLKK